MMIRQLVIDNTQLKLRPLISFVILSWNSSKTIEEMLLSVYAALEDNHISEYEVFVVDNGSTDATLSYLDKFERSYGLKLIKLPTNRGTTYSRNLALREAKGKYICIMDSDVTIRQWDITKSLDYIDVNTCLVAPQLIYPDGRIQNSVKKYPTITAKLLKLTKILFGIERFAYTDFYSDFPFVSARQVETAISAFWLFPASIIQRIGYLDENIFYAPEDIDFCVRLRKEGIPIIYFPAIKAIHYTQQISHKRPFNRVALSHLAGLLYYFRKHEYLFSARKLREMSIEESPQ